MPDEVQAGEGDLESSHRHRCAPGVHFPPTHPHHQHHQHHCHYDYHSSIIRIIINIMVFVVAVIIIVKSSSCPQVHFPPTWPTACNLAVWSMAASVLAYKTVSVVKFLLCFDLIPNLCKGAFQGKQGTQSVWAL